MYLDPGFGGILIQVLVAIVATGGILVFSLRRKLRALFSKKKVSDTDSKKDDTAAATVDTAEDEAVDMLSDDDTGEEIAAADEETNVEETADN